MQNVVVETLVPDIETTGLAPKDAAYEVEYMKFPRIVSFGYKINADVPREFIINQEGFIIPEDVIKIHGITNEMCNASQYYLADVIREFLTVSKGAKLVVGFNIYFDTSTVKANVLRLIKEGKLTQADFDELTELLHKDRRIDVMRKGQKLTGKWPKLQELYQFLFGKPFKGHTAAADCDACYECYIELKKRGLA